MIEYLLKVVVSSPGYLRSQYREQNHSDIAVPSFQKTKPIFAL